MAALQKVVDGRLAEILTPEQKKQWDDLRNNMGRGGPGFGPWAALFASREAGNGHRGKIARDPASGRLGGVASRSGDDHC